MEYNPKASAAAARMAAMTANENAVHARLAADSAAAYARRLEIDAKAKAYGFSHDDVLRALDTAYQAKFEDMLAKEHPGEAIVPKACTTRIGGAAGGGCGGIHPGDLLVSKDVAADHMAALQSAAFNPWPEMLAASREILRLNTQIASLLQRWDGDGLPTARTT